ncbi:MAG TPA: hypothetical protein VGJ94_03490 [Syntrophorhabdaceae bacterium]
MNLQEVNFVETKGRIVRDCPGTKNHVCCGYKTIDLIEGCVLSCSYCILKYYMNTAGISVHGDIPYILSQIEEEIEGELDHVLRFGTGELSDSLALDRRFRLNGPLMEYFGEKKRALLELKSKWADISPIAPFLNPYTVVSFSLAPQRSIDREERRTSPLYKRLKAARKAQEMGSFVGLHLDPVIIYDGFEKDYEYLTEDICRILDPERIIWISLGLLRFPPGLMDHFIEHERRNLLYGEFIRGEDGKYRYLKKERVKVYKMLQDMLKSRSPDLFVYLCMERPDVWREAMGKDLATSGDLVDLFDDRIRKFYGGGL